MKKKIRHRKPKFEKLITKLSIDEKTYTKENLNWKEKFRHPESPNLKKTIQTQKQLYLVRKFRQKKLKSQKNLWENLYTQKFKFDEQIPDCESKFQKKILQIHKS